MPFENARCVPAALVVLALSVVASEAASGRSVARYDIPAQSLAPALESYARVSSREVLYDGRLAEGRRSSLVQGSYPADVALRILLAGSGLEASNKDDRFFMLSPQPAEAAPGQAALYDFYAKLQAALRSAWCHQQSWPGARRVAARLWLDDAGRVLQVKLLAASIGGNDEARAVAVLRRLQVGQPPPGFAQPVTIVITAVSEGYACAPQDAQAVRELR